jgi:polysaccharide pyruvyl transferase WcaK-like protein
MDQVRLALGECEFRTVCSDASGFNDTAYVQWRSGVDDFVPFANRRVRMMLTSFFGAHSTIARLAEGADLIVAVGGGYLRGGHLAESIKSAGAHLGQMRLARRYGHKMLYLPQSIGPFRGLYLRVIRQLLSKVRYVFVRDERSMQELIGLPNVYRMPDLAVLELAQSTEVLPDAVEEPSNSDAPQNRPVLVVRELRKPRNYYRFLQEAKDSARFEWAIQASGGGNNDIPITQRYASSQPRMMPEILEDPTRRVVVSTRLHGALSSLIAGFPAIHLSYERKGWGAFEDLGLDGFVLNARDASLRDVQTLIAELSKDQAGYWKKIDESRLKIASMQERLTQSIRMTVGSSIAPSSVVSK